MKLEYDFYDFSPLSFCIQLCLLVKLICMSIDNVQTDMCFTVISGALTSPRPSVSPPGPRVSNWRPSHVDITAVTEGGGGALKVTFDAAPDNLSIPGYEVGLQNATNNTIGSPLYVQDPKVSDVFVLKAEKCAYPILPIMLKNIVVHFRIFYLMWFEHLKM